MFAALLDCVQHWASLDGALWLGGRVRWGAHSCLSIHAWPGGESRCFSSITVHRSSLHRSVTPLTCHPLLPCSMLQPRSVRPAMSRP